MLRYFTAGESHGPCLAAIIDGVPAGFPIDVKKINHDLWRRPHGRTLISSLLYPQYPRAGQRPRYGLTHGGRLLLQTIACSLRDKSHGLYPLDREGGGQERGAHLRRDLCALRW